MLFQNVISPPMLVFIICLACLYIVSAAFLFIGMWKAPYGFEDEKGFHRTGAPASLSGETEAEAAAGNPPRADESKEVPTESVMRARSRSRLGISGIRWRNSGSSSRKGTQPRSN